MKNNYYFFIILLIFLLSLVCPVPSYAFSLLEEDSMTGFNTEGILLAKAKKKKKKKKKKSKSKKSKKSKSSEERQDSLDEASSSGAKSKQSSSFIGIGVSYMGKGIAAGNIYADVKVGISSFYPYVDFMYTFVGGAFSIMHFGGGLLYSIPMGSLHILGGVGAQYGMWKRSDQEYDTYNIERIFDPESGITQDEEIPPSAAFIYVVPRVQLVYRVTNFFAITADVGGLIAVSEGVLLSEEGKKFTATTFLIGAGGMITF